MNSTALRGLLILMGAFVLCFAIFVILGPPGAGGGVEIDSGIFTTVAAGTYALTSLAAIVFARAVLGMFVGNDDSRRAYRNKEGVRAWLEKACFCDHNCCCTQRKHCCELCHPD